VRHPDKEPAATVHLFGGGRPDYVETGPCTGPTGEHEFAIGRWDCVFCARAQRIIGRGFGK
jgi:hypothetical protein